MGQRPRRQCLGDAHFRQSDIAGLAFNWAWDDRDEGDYEVLINGTISLGSFSVNSGTSASTESPEANTYVIFDSAQTGVTSVQINMSGDTQYGLDELEVYTAVPEPSSAALLGLGGFALIFRRRR